MASFITCLLLLLLGRLYAEAPYKLYNQTVSPNTTALELPLPFEIQGDIVECGQIISGSLDPYYNEKENNPQIYRFDFRDWSSTNLITQHALAGGYYLCQSAELEQAQTYGRMVENEILSSINDAANCGKTTERIQVISAAKQVVAGTNYRANVQVCDGEQLALISFFVPLSSEGIIQTPANVTLISMQNTTFTIDPCNTQYPLHIMPVISVAKYNEHTFYDEMYVPVVNTALCANGYNWQWKFTPNTTRFGYEYIFSWLGVAGSEAQSAYNKTDGSYSVGFECSASSVTTVEPTTTALELPLPFEIEGDITECGQSISGSLDPYYNEKQNNPQIYHFDFEKWSQRNVETEQGLIGGYYLCQKAELEQAKTYGRMLENDEVLSTINDATQCGTKTEVIKIISAAKQVVAGTNYRANVQVCDGEQLALISFFVPLSSDGIIQTPTNATLISIETVTFTIDPCNTQYPLRIEPIISVDNYNERVFYDLMFVPVINNSVKCRNGYNWQWEFTPNTTRFGYEYIISWLGVAGSEAQSAYNKTDGSYSVGFECSASSVTTVEPTTTALELPLPFEIEGDITKCEQTIYGSLNPYYNEEENNPQIYRFDFRDWSSTNLITEHDLAGGYYLCQGAELEQAQAYGRMVKNDVLSSINDANCGKKMKRIQVISAAKQVVVGTNYRANVEVCDGEQLALISFFVPLSSEGIIQTPTNVELISMQNTTFIIDPCNTQYPLHIDPVISVAKYNEHMFYDEMYVPVVNTVQCTNGYNWQWEFTPNTTRFGYEYIFSWLGVSGSEAQSAYDKTDGSYSVDFKCTALSVTTTSAPISSSSSSHSSVKEEESGLEAVPGYVWLLLLIVSLVFVGVLLVLWLRTKKALESVISSSMEPRDNASYVELQNDDSAA